MIRPSFLAAIGLAVAVVSIGGTLSLDNDEATPFVALSSQNDDGGYPMTLPLESHGGPMVDAMRIGAKGQAVIIGRANPGAVISVTDNGREWGGAMADGRGEWVFVPDGPLTPQAHTLKIEQVSAMGRGHAMLYVGCGSDGWSGALVVSQLKDGSLHVLQAGHVFQAGEMGAASATALPVVGWIEQTADGRMTVGGVTKANAVVEVHMDNNLLGRMQADQRGEWQMSAKAPAPGEHHLRVERINPLGVVESKSEVPWQIVAPSTLTADVLDIHPIPEGWVLDRPIGGGKSAHLVTINP